MKPLSAAALGFLEKIAGSTVKEACLLLKYGNDEELLYFRDIATDFLGKDPLPEELIPFKESVEALRTARTANDVRKVFLGNDPRLHATTTLDFFTDLADANESEGDILMRSAWDKHLFALRDTAMELLVGKVPLTENQESALEPFWAEIRELALAKNATEISKTLFQHFSGRLLLLQGIVIPSLTQNESTSQ
ncbi:hypothetical protein AAVH_11474 [Aphelenchoides avenae]|nr:hypothetical protein AAVH_11474 [Aphelenchus avenae]